MIWQHFQPFFVVTMLALTSRQQHHSTGRFSQFWVQITIEEDVQEFLLHNIIPSNNDILGNRVTSWDDVYCHSPGYLSGKSVSQVRFANYFC